MKKTVNLFLTAALLVSGFAFLPAQAQHQHIGADKASTMLPATVTGFTAKASGNKVVISWTGTGNSFNHYLLQRSVDGSRFEDVALLFPEEGSTHYQYKDATIAQASYRLLTVVRNETAAHLAATCSVQEEERKTGSLGARPNPVGSSVQLSIPQAWQGKALRMELVSAAGTPVQTITIQNAAAVETVATQNWKTGVYVVSLSCNGEMRNACIVKN